MKKININIWDDFYEDDYVPAGEIQETYVYVEDDITLNEKKDILEFLMTYIQNNILLDNVIYHMNFFDSKIKYPNIPEEYKSLQFERWEIKVVNITHKQLDILLKKLQNANLEYNNFKLNIYSES